jgi:pyridoxine 4-dehydrogenase
MTTRSSAKPVVASGIFAIGGDLEVNRLGFGAMQLPGEGVWGEPDDRQQASSVLRRAIELGVNLIDTADAYGPEVSENLICEALHPYPSDLVIATKGGLTRPGPGQWAPVGRPEYLRQCVEMSLRRLKLECIDLYQLHRIDPQVPAEESLGELGKLQAEGKIRHIGLSEVTVEQLRQAQRVVTVATVQNRYNLIDRTSEEVLDACTEEGIGFIPWFPLATGELAGPGSPLAQVAERVGATPSQIALAWLLHRSPVMLPIPGTSSVSHLEENCAAATIELPDEDWARLPKAG